MKFRLNFFRKSDDGETLEPVTSARAEIRHPPEQLRLILTGVALLARLSQIAYTIHTSPETPTPAGSALTDGTNKRALVIICTGRG